MKLLKLLVTLCVGVGLVGGVAAAQPAPTVEDRAPVPEAQPVPPADPPSPQVPAPSDEPALGGPGMAKPDDNVPPATAKDANGKGPAMPPWITEIDNRPYEHYGNFWMPPAGATAAEADNMFYAVLALSAFFFFAITGVLVYFVIKYRHRPGHKSEPSSAHNDTMEITWSVIPSIICVFLFIGGWNGYMKLQTRPPEPEVIKVTAKKWTWDFEYENGLHLSDLHVPKDRPVELQMTSVDVLHSFYVPAFRVKQDIVPRRYTYIFFTPSRLGTYRLYCTEYCGRDHSQMKVKAHVHEPAVFDRYLDEVKAARQNMDPKDLGKDVFEKKGCVACHTIDGSAKVGPSWKGIWDTEVQVSGGSVTVDAQYIKDSILEPQKQLRSGFPPSMPSYAGQLNEAEINGVTEYIKSLK